jgi:putative acetyltransferase
VIIRRERPGDEAEIFTITQDAFKTMPFSHGTEGPIIEQLRDDNDLTLSLVAIMNDQIIGHIAFSPINITGVEGKWFGIGPVSVTPKLQKQGIGSKLIREGLSILKMEGADGCALIGDPNYYARFGFKSDGKLNYGDTPKEFVQWISFRNIRPTGKLIYSPAFSQDYN